MGMIRYFWTIYIYLLTISNQYEQNLQTEL